MHLESRCTGNSTKCNVDIGIGIVNGYVPCILQPNTRLLMIINANFGQNSNFQYGVLNDVNTGKSN